MNMTFAHRAKIAGRMLFKGISGSWLTISGNRGIGMTDFSPDEAATALRKSAILSMCIGRWAIEYPQVSFVVHDSKGKPQTNHDFLKRLTKPNVGMDLSEFLTVACTYKAWTGTTMLHKLRNKSGIFIGMEPRHALEMRKERNEKGEVIRWIWTNQRGEQKEVPLEDVITLPWHVRDPSDVSLGVSPLHACWTERSTYDMVNEYVYQFLKNGGLPPFVISTDEPLSGTDDEKKAVREQFEQKYSLRGGGIGRNMFLDGTKLNVQKIGTNLQELALDGLRNTPEANICGAFGVPAMLVGANVGLNHSTYSNVKEARRGFVENTLVPAWEADASRLSRILEEEYGMDGWYLLPDLSRVAALKEDEDKKATRAVTGFEKNVLTRDEARGIIGLDAVDGANVFAIDLQQAKLPTGKSGDSGINPLFFKSAADFDALWKSLDDEKLTHVEALAKKLKKQAGLLADSMLASAKSENGTDGSIALKRDPKMPTDRELKRIFEDGTDTERKELVAAMLRRATKDADFDWDDVSGWMDDAEKEATKASAEGISDSYGNLKNELKELINENAGATYDQLKDALGSWVKGYQAHRIAQTTVTKTTTVSQQGAWGTINKRRDDGKEIEQMWLSERDLKVRDLHSKRDGMQRKLGEDFDGSDGPGLSGDPADDVNCRCVVIAVTVKKGK